jgi:hypothetical protein
MPELRQHHLVTVWNPSIAPQAMDDHIAVLLAGLRRFREGSGETDPCVWFGRVRSPNRQQPLPHFAEVLALDAETPMDERDAREAHLYLTDYRSLYVGQLGSITGDDMSAEEPAAVPEYYRQLRLDCDCWFQLFDIRRIVEDDTLAVVAELRKLRNVHYSDRPVSIYGGMVNLPLVVYRDDGIRFFEDRERLLDGQLWVEFDAGNAGLGALERDLRDNLLGEAAWTSLDAGTRSFITTAERIFRDNRANAGFDFAPVLGGFAKALEVECNRRLRDGLNRCPFAARLANLDGETVDVTARSLTLGELVRALSGEQELRTALANRLTHAGWFSGDLAVILDGFRDVRNRGTHSGRIERAVAQHWRDRMVGVGCEGIFVRLASVRRR